MSLYNASQVAEILNGAPAVDPNMIFNAMGGEAYFGAEAVNTYNNMWYTYENAPALYREIYLNPYLDAWQAGGGAVTPTATEVLVPQAAVNAQTGAVQGTTAARMPAVTTPAGNVKAGALAGRIPIGTLIAGTAIGAGVGLKEVAQHPKFWNDLSDAVFNDLKNPETYISKPLAETETADIIWRCLEDGSIQSYCDKRSIDKVVQRLYEFNVINSGRVEPGIDHSGSQAVTYGDVDVQVVATAAAIAGHTPPSTAIAAAFSGAVNHAGSTPFNAISANVTENQNDRRGRISVSLYNMPDTITIIGDGTAQSPFAVDRPQRYGVDCCVAVYDIDTSEIIGVSYESASSICYTSPLSVGSNPATGFCSNVGAVVIPTNPAVIPDPNATPAPNNINDFWNTYAAWLANGFTTNPYNPITNAIEPVTYVPITAPDKNWQVEPITGDQQNVWQGLYDFVAPFTTPSPLAVNNPSPWIFESIGNFFKTNTDTPTPTPWDNNPKFPQPTPTPVGSTPTIAAPTSGLGSSNKLYTVYNPTQAEVDALGAYLWTQNIVELIAQFFQNPLEAIISLHMIYCTPTVAAPKHIMLGYLDSGVSAAIVTSQYEDIPCGYVDIPEFYGNALDYTGVAVQIFLPFIGYRVLKTKEVMGRRLEVDYKVDVYTGTCLAFLYVISANTRQLLYTFEGNCSVQIPLTAADRTRLIAGITTAGLSAFTGNPAGVVGGIASIGANIERSGSFSGNAGAMNVKKPFVVITRAINAQASHYNTLYGYPLNKYGYLRNFRGYTRVQSVHVDIPNATEKEKAMIDSMLRNGIKI